MLTIGIVDVTTVGSTICQRRISELGGATGNHPEFAVHSIPFVQYRDAVLKKDWDTMENLITKSLKKLKRLDVDFIIVPSNTPHYAYKKYAASSAVPVLDLIEITADTCEAAKLKKVAVLGTKATMTSGLYKEKIENRGMSLVIPPEKTCDAIHHFIMNEIVPGTVNPKTRANVLQLIKTIDCDGFILGCTELPEVYSTQDLGKTAIDTTRLLANTAFNIAKDEDMDAIKTYAYA